MLDNDVMTGEPIQNPEILIEDIADQLAQIYRNCRPHFRKSAHMEGLDLTMAQLRAILCLEDNPMRMSGLAEALGVSLPSATGIVDRLVDRGLVNRREDPEDRRLVICELTPGGQHMVVTFYEADRAIIRAVLTSLSLDEIRIVQRAFELLNIAASEQSGPVATRMPLAGSMH